MSAFKQKLEKEHANYYITRESCRKQRVDTKERVDSRKKYKLSTKINQVETKKKIKNQQIQNLVL